MPDTSDEDFYKKLTMAELARVIQEPYRNIAKWQKQGVPFHMDGPKKFFDSRKVINWMITNATTKAYGNKSVYSDAEKATIKRLAKNGELSEEELLEGPTTAGDNLDRLRGAKADIAEIDLAKRRGELIQREEHELFVVNASDTVRKAFQAMPKKMSVKLAKCRDAAEAERILEAEVLEILRDLAARGAKVGQDSAR